MLITSVHKCIATRCIVPGNQQALSTKPIGRLWWWVLVFVCSGFVGWVFLIVCLF